MKKLIFLDIDGVLNNYSFHGKWMSERKKENPDISQTELALQFKKCFLEATEYEFFNGYIVPENLDNFNRIIDATNADIVLSSDWRFINDGNYNNVADINVIKQLFKVRGIKGNVLDSTPLVSIRGDRAIEILRYIRANNLNDTRIVVIDDLREAGEALRDIPDSMFIWTDYKTGLTKEEAEEAIEFLNKGE